MIDCVHIDIYKRKSMKNITAVALIIILGAIAYANTLGNDFVWDDQHLIVNNTRIESFSSINQVFNEELFHQHKKSTGYYRPIQVISYMFDYFLWGRDPMGYHITSIVIQIINAILVFYICLLLLGKRSISLFIASIFCIHPAFVAVVSYISGRADLIGCMFGLLSIYGALRYITHKKNPLTLYLSLIFYVLAILSKEYYITAPIFVWLYLIIFHKKVNIDRHLSIFNYSILVIIGSYLLFRASSYQVLTNATHATFYERLGVAPYILSNYVITLLAPFNIGMEKKIIFSSLAEPRFIVSYITPIIVLWVGYHFHKTAQKIKLFALGWFVIGLLPLLNILFPLKTLWANHWVYMASIGLFILLTVMIDSLAALSDKTRLKTISACLVIACFTIITINENRYWKNEETFFARTLEQSPRHSRALFNMGKAHENKGDYEKAMDCYNEAIQESGKVDQYYYTRGHLYRKMGNLEQTKNDFEMTVQLSPKVALYHNDLGTTYAQLGMLDKAKIEWEKTLEIDPDFGSARRNLSRIQQ